MSRKEIEQLHGKFMASLDEMKAAAADPARQAEVGKILGQLIDAAKSLADFHAGKAESWEKKCCELKEQLGLFQKPRMG